MKNLCFLLVLLTGCSRDLPAEDAGEVSYRDAAIDAYVVDLDGGVDAQTFSDATDAASELCVGVPTDGSRQLFQPQQNSCGGPLALTVDMELWSTASCTGFAGSIEVVCDGLNTHWPFNQMFRRDGTVYTTYPINFTCEEVVYTCTLSKDALSNTVSLDCMYGPAICTVAFEADNE